MRNELLAALIMFGHACGVDAPQSDKSQDGDDLARELRLVLKGDGRGAFADCQAFAEDLGQKITGHFQAEVLDIESSPTREDASRCDSVVTYRPQDGAPKLAVDAIAPSENWLDPFWEYKDLAECEAGRAAVKDALSSHMRALVVSDRCYTANRPVSQLVYPEFEVTFIRPDPAPARVVSLALPAALSKSWQKAQAELAARDAVLVRDHTVGGTRVLRALESTSQNPWRLERATFNWFDHVFASSEDCEASLAQIDAALRTRFSGEALDRSCAAADDGFKPDLYYYSEAVHLGQTSVRPGPYFVAMSECAAALAAQNEAAQESLHYCAQESRGARRFLIAYFAR